MLQWYWLKFTYLLYFIIANLSPLCISVTVYQAVYTSMRVHTHTNTNTHTHTHKHKHSSFSLSGLLCILLILLLEHATASLPVYIYVYTFICVHRYNNSEIIPYLFLPGAMYGNGLSLKTQNSPFLVLLMPKQISNDEEVHSSKRTNIWTIKETD